MVFWYLAPSIVAVHDIFRSRGLDYRLIALGAILPLLIDAPLGYYAYGHSLFVAVGAPRARDAGRPSVGPGSCAAS